MSKLLTGLTGLTGARDWLQRHPTLNRLVGVVALRHQHRGQAVGILRRIDAEQLQPPGLHRRARRLAEPDMAGEDLVQAFLQQHGDGLLEAIEQVGRGRVGKEAGLVGRQHVGPVPIGA